MALCLGHVSQGWLCNESLAEWCERPNPPGRPRVGVEAHLRHVALLLLGVLIAMTGDAHHVAV